MTNALRLLAHFFRRLPRSLFQLKNKKWQSSKKIERKNKTNPKPQAKWKVGFVLAFTFSIKNNFFFFQLKNN
ncbi:hypothetical protein BWK63_04120 [Flavobacterium covae]|nr:hypothetical protein BWK63_04085 [Flavobacterium covae]OWP81733.1 hypothetical protein BWK63_04120 [Flavobacterium covae]POR21361.1 hypothetical protein BWK57_10305 [Flavobacterium columnare]POR21368.1 hypothetical protein BWK57_10340 [Flavobacterium columnare]